MSSGLRSGQVAQAADVNVQTLRYYERRGLLDEPERTLGGHRLYPPESVTVLKVIKAAQRLGFTLAEVADLLDVGRHRHSARRPGLRASAAAKLAEVEASIADLAVIRATLQAALDAGCDDPVACAGSTCCPVPFVAVSHGDVEGPPQCPCGSPRIAVAQRRPTGPRGAHRTQR